MVGNGGAILKTTSGGGPSVGVQELEKPSKFKLFPNPNNGEFFIEFNNPKHLSASISIYNLSGQRVFETTTRDSNLNLNASNLTAGIYLIRIIADKTYTQKMVVNKNR